jgi:hypothetical protein
MEKCYALFDKFPLLNSSVNHLPLVPELAKPPEIESFELPPLVKDCDLPSIGELYSGEQFDQKRLIPLVILGEVHLIEFMWIYGMDNPSVRIIFELLSSGKAFVVAKRVVKKKGKYSQVNQWVFEGKRVFPYVMPFEPRDVKASDLVDMFIEHFEDWSKASLSTSFGSGYKAKKPNLVENTLPVKEEDIMAEKLITNPSGLIFIKKGCRLVSGQTLKYHINDRCRAIRGVEIETRSAAPEGYEPCKFCQGTNRIVPGGKKKVDTRSDLQKLSDQLAVNTFSLPDIQTIPLLGSIEQERTAIALRLEVLDIAIKLMGEGRSREFVDGYLYAKGVSFSS